MKLLFASAMAPIPIVHACLFEFGDRFVRDVRFGGAEPLYIASLTVDSFQEAVFGDARLLDRLCQLRERTHPSFGACPAGCRS